VSTKSIGAEREQVLTQQMLERDAFTIRNDEDGEDVAIYASEDDEGEGIPLRTDDEIPIQEEEGWGGLSNADGLWMETVDGGTTTVTILKGVALRRNVRRQNVSIGTAVFDENEDKVPPASDSFDSASGSDVDVNAATESVDLVPPHRASTVRVNVDNADGAFHVAVEFDGGTTVRDDTNSSDYAGDGSTDVLVTVPVLSPDVTVKIVDDSGGANTVDYTMYVG
jgi:hypothetical protein